MSYPVERARETLLVSRDDDFVLGWAGRLFWLLGWLAPIWTMTEE